MESQMPAWVWITIVAAAVAVFAVVWVASGRARPGKVINPADDAAVQAARAQAERVNLSQEWGGPGMGGVG